jgi:hypothetical protein
VGDVVRQEIDSSVKACMPEDIRAIYLGISKWIVRGIYDRDSACMSVILSRGGYGVFYVDCHNERSMWRTRVPLFERASSMAGTMTAGTGSMPGSPTPLNSRGLSGESRFKNSWTCSSPCRNWNRVRSLPHLDRDDILCGVSKPPETELWGNS